MFEDENIIETEIEEIPQRLDPPVWYAMTDGAGKVVDIRGSEQIFPVNPDVWHEISDGEQYASNLYDENNIYKYKLTDGEIIERSEEERAEDIPPIIPYISMEERVEALKNSLDAHFDGLKYIADRENPLSLTLPMYVRANLIYRYNGVNYVAVKNEMVNSNNFDDVLVLD